MFEDKYKNENEKTKEHELHGPMQVVYERLADLIADLMAMRVRKYEIKRQVSIQLYGTLYEKKVRLSLEGKNILEPLTEADKELPGQLMDQSVFEKLSSMGREVLRTRAMIQYNEAKEDSVGLYENIIADPRVNPATKIKAQENLDKIFGLVNGDNSTTAEEIAAKAVAALCKANRMMEAPRGESDPDSEMD